MKPIENILELPRGGVFLGLFAGVWAATLPAATFSWGAPWWLPPVAVAVILASQIRRRVLPLWAVAACVPTLGVSSLAYAMHVDPRIHDSDLDFRISDALPSRHIAIDELDRRIAWGDDEVSQEVIDLQSTRPTWRQLEAALAPYGYHLQLRFGPSCQHPTRVHILPGPPSAG
jgi:hypothetical protein